MRFAVSVRDGKVSAHFGHCSHFALFDVDEVTKTIVRRGVIPSVAYQARFHPDWLAEHRVSIVIANGIGCWTHASCRENRIAVAVGALGDDKEKAVLDYVKGQLPTDDNICDH